MCYGLLMCKQKRVFIEKQSPLKECQYWLKLRIPIVIGLEYLNKKRGYIVAVTIMDGR